MLRPWFINLIAAPPERTGTALEAALLRAVEQALFNPRHELHRAMFDYYREPDARAPQEIRNRRFPAEEKERTNA